MADLWQARNSQRQVRVHRIDDLIVVTRAVRGVRGQAVTPYGERWNLYRFLDAFTPVDDPADRKEQANG